jgi:parallel beta-helix repeat protein
MRWAPDLSQSSATHFQPLLVNNFVSVGVTAKNVWFLYRFDMPYVSSLSRSARSPSGQVLLLGPEAHCPTLTALRQIGHTGYSYRTRGARLRRRQILLVPLLALFAFVATTEERAEAVSFGDPVQGELMESQPTGTSVVNDPMYQEGQALKFSGSGVTAIETVTFPANSGLHDVELLARASQSGGSPTLRVSVNGIFTAEAQAIDNRLGLKTYTFDVNAPSGSSVKIGVRADNTATGRNAFVDVLSFPSSGGSTPDGDRDSDGVSDGLDNCSDVPNSGQRDVDGDGVGNACDQCDNDFGPAPTGCPADPGGTPGGGTTTWPNCIGTQIEPGDNLATIINNDSGTKATRFCVHRGTYPVSTQAMLKAGDKLDAEPGTWTSEGPARVPTPVVKLEGRGTDNLLRADGDDISISWVDLSGASGTGNGTGAIAAGSAGSDFLVEYSRIHDNDSLGISNMNGTVRYSEFFMNSGAPSSLGFNGSAVKGITEYEADGVYVHEEQGNGLWCDVGCKNSARATPGCPTGCFWVHHSVVVNSKRAGIRYENSSSEALFQNNVIRGNGISEHRGGIDIRDSQDAQVLNNILSANNGIGVRATDSGRSDRVNLDKILVQDNDLGGDRIVTCGGPVECINNTNVGTK